MASTNTSLPALEAALGGLPAEFRKRLIKAYVDVKKAWANGDHDACGLRGGKFCEVLLRYLQHELTGAHTAFGDRLPVFVDECRRLEQVPKASGPESLRVLMPRALNFVYTLRNKRDIGHVGGDLDANEIDAATMLRTIDWCLSELIRVKHDISLEEAQALLDAIAERQLPVVWAVAGRKRVLNTSLTLSDQTLLLLYSDPDSAVAIEDLAEWVEASRLSNFKDRVIAKLHAARLIEFDSETFTVVLSPTGAEAAEEILRRLGKT